MENITHMINQNYNLTFIKIKKIINHKNISKIFYLYILMKSYINTYIKIIY